MLMAEEPQATETIGPAPSDAADIRKIFLRQSGVLLRPGVVEAEVGANYSRTQTGINGLSRATTRKGSFPLGLRAGILPRVEVFGSIPYVTVYRDTEDTRQQLQADQQAQTIGVVPVTEFDDDQDAGFGDVSAGLSLQLKYQDAYWPDIVVSASATLPTGEDPFGAGVVAPVGSGFESYSADLRFVRASDPIVIFSGVGYTFFQDETFDGVNLDPSDRVNYDFGLGFAVNPNISLSSQFLGAYEDPTRVDGSPGPRGAREQMSIRLGMTSRLTRDAYLETTATFGITDDAEDALIGVALVQRFDLLGE